MAGTPPSPPSFMNPNQIRHFLETGPPFGHPSFGQPHMTTDNTTGVVEDIIRLSSPESITMRSCTPDSPMADGMTREEVDSDAAGATTTHEVAETLIGMGLASTVPVEGMVTLEKDTLKGDPSKTPPRMANAHHPPPPSPHQENDNSHNHQSLPPHPTFPGMLDTYAERPHPEFESPISRHGDTNKDTEDDKEDDHDDASSDIPLSELMQIRDEDPDAATASAAVNEGGNGDKGVDGWSSSSEAPAAGDDSGAGNDVAVSDCPQRSEGFLAGKEPSQEQVAQAEERTDMEPLAMGRAGERSGNAMGMDMDVDPNVDDGAEGRCPPESSSPPAPLNVDHGMEASRFTASIPDASMHDSSRSTATSSTASLIVASSGRPSPGNSNIASTGVVADVAVTDSMSVTSSSGNVLNATSSKAKPPAAKAKRAKRPKLVHGRRKQAKSTAAAVKAKPKARKKSDDSPLNINGSPSDATCDTVIETSADRVKSRRRMKSSQDSDAGPRNQKKGNQDEQWEQAGWTGEVWTGEDWMEGHYAKPEDDVEAICAGLPSTHQINNVRRAYAILRGDDHHRNKTKQDTCKRCWKLRTGQATAFPRVTPFFGCIQQTDADGLTQGSCLECSLRKERCQWEGESQQHQSKHQAVTPPPPPSKSKSLKRKRDRAPPPVYEDVVCVDGETSDEDDPRDASYQESSIAAGAEDDQPPAKRIPHVRRHFAASAVPLPSMTLVREVPREPRFKPRNPPPIIASSSSYAVAQVEQQQEKRQPQPQPQMQPQTQPQTSVLEDDPTIVGRLAKPKDDEARYFELFGEPRGELMKLAYRILRGPHKRFKGGDRCTACQTVPTRITKDAQRGVPFFACRRKITPEGKITGSCTNCIFKSRSCSFQQMPDVMAKPGDQVVWAKKKLGSAQSSGKLDQVRSAEHSIASGTIANGSIATRAIAAEAIANEAIATESMAAGAIKAMSLETAVASAPPVALIRAPEGIDAQAGAHPPATVGPSPAASAAAPADADEHGLLQLSRLATAVLQAMTAMERTVGSTVLNKSTNSALFSSVWGLEHLKEQVESAPPSLQNQPIQAFGWKGALDVVGQACEEIEQKEGAMEGGGDGSAASAKLELALRRLASALAKSGRV